MTSKIILSDGTTELTGIKSVVFHESVNSGRDIRPGCVGSAYIEVEVFGTQSGAVTAGEELTYYQVDGGGNETLIGKFYAEPTIATKKSYRFIAYDAASKLDADFSDWLSSNQNNFPMTVYALADAACTVAGVTLGTASWPLSTQTVNAFYADGLTCRNILEYAAEIAGRFVRCNTAGNIIFDWYATNNTDSIHPGADQTGHIAYRQDGLNYENYTTSALDRVAVYPSGTEDAAYIYPANVSSGNTLAISGNLLLTGASAATYNAVAQNVYSVMSALGAYRPMTVSLFPGENPFRAGEIVSVTDSQGVSFRSVLTGMTVSASDAILESAGNETLENRPSNLERTIANLSNDIVQINKLKVGYAEIDEAVIDSLEVNGVDGNWINANSISTDKLSVGQGGNLYPVYDSFEQVTSDNLYFGKDSSATPTVLKSQYARNGSKVLRIATATGATNAWVSLGAASNDYGLVRLPAGQYVASAYFRRYNMSTDVPVRLSVIGKQTLDGSLATGEWTRIAYADTTMTVTGWTRVEVPFAVESGTAYPFIHLRPSVMVGDATVYVDCMQIEAVTDGQGAGEWHPAGVTQLDGGNIVAQSIKADSLDVNDLFAEDIVATGSFQVNNNSWKLLQDINGLTVETTEATPTLDVPVATLMVRTDYCILNTAVESSGLVRWYGFDASNGQYATAPRATMQAGDTYIIVYDERVSIGGGSGQTCDVDIIGDLLPVNDQQSRNIGSSSRRWANVYASAVNIGGYPAIAKRTKTVTGTTNSSGNIALSLAVADYGILCVYRSDATSICTPYYPTSVTGWYVHVTTTAGAAVTSTSVTLVVDYYAK